MNADEMTRHILDTFDGVTALEATGDTFFIYDPHGDLPAQRQLPFATIVTGDHYDTVSDLNRPGAYRLNIGLTRAGYTTLFGPAPSRRDEQGVLDTGVDYAATDTLMPHPIYASQHWVSVVDPGDATLPAVRALLAEAHGFAARKHANQRTRRSPA
ncbi:DUF6194 family protein [Micromonospora thermarum]|uniref:DUF6194 domain-containing protein n=1 Tax=Micromonospora thermarum TaxID=2720024 RepID=A0ABX0Z9T0_9ACTN|nr:DUF6194 family protein [Micromonospora thermarum]NJP33982.1 hypothetical protein [Micromonospora thermarum]